MSVDMNKHNQKKVNRLIKIIDPIYEKYIQKAHDENILSDKEHAKAVAYGLDNLFNAPKRKDIWKRDIIFPTHKIPYEDILVLVPNKEYEFCEICFPGWPYIPNDICNHSHMPENVINSPECIDEMLHFLSQ